MFREALSHPPIITVYAMLKSLFIFINNIPCNRRTLKKENHENLGKKVYGGLAYPYPKIICRGKNIFYGYQIQFGVVSTRILYDDTTKVVYSNVVVISEGTCFIYFYM